MSSSKLVFELCYTRQQTGENVWNTCCHVFDEKSYQCVVMAVRNRIWGLVNRKRFYLRLVRFGNVTVSPQVSVEIPLVDVTSYESICLALKRSVEYITMVGEETEVTSQTFVGLH